MRALFGSLWLRVLLLTMSVAVAGVLSTGFVSLQLITTATIAKATSQLAAQADVLSRLPVASTLSALGTRAQLALGETQVAVVQKDGAISGSAATSVTKNIARALVAGHSISRVKTAHGTTIVIEGRPAANGTAIVLARSESSIASSSTESVQLIMVALASALVVAIACAVALTRWLSQPLFATVAAARKMAAGERGLVLTVHRPAEIADLAAALAALDHALSTSEGRQRDFLLSVTRELRSPLAALRTLAQSMASGEISERRIAAVGANLVAETARLDSFVADLLELARLEADDLTINSHDVELESMLSEIDLTWSERCRRFDISFRAGAPYIPITTDSRRLRQVIDALLENAVRVTPAGGAILVSAHTNGIIAEIAVTDGGRALGSRALAASPSSGLQQDRRRDVRVVGTGLGLSIAARLITRLGGSIRAESVMQASGAGASGSGAVVTITIPLG